MINHLNLIYFIAAAKELNFTKAADKLYISQQALSNHVSSLEKELGVPLFERGQTLDLTYAGEVFYKYALQMEDCYHRMQQEIEDIRSEKMGELTIGISHTRGRVLLPEILPPFMEKYPLMRVRVQEGNTDELTLALRNGEIDIVIGQPQMRYRHICYETLQTEKIMLVVADSLLSRYDISEQQVQNELIEKGNIRLLKNMPFLLNKRGNATRIAADDIFRQEGMAPHILIETENIETLGEMCKDGIGVAFYPSALLKTLADGREDRNLHILKLNYSCTDIPLAVGYRDNCYMSKAMKEMIQIIRQKVQ